MHSGVNGRGRKDGVVEVVAEERRLSLPKVGRATSIPAIAKLWPMRPHLNYLLRDNSAKVRIDPLTSHIRHLPSSLSPKINFATLAFYMPFGFQY